LRHNATLILGVPGCGKSTLTMYLNNLKPGQAIDTDIMAVRISESKFELPIDMLEKALFSKLYNYYIGIADNWRQYKEMFQEVYVLWRDETQLMKVTEFRNKVVVSMNEIGLSHRANIKIDPKQVVESQRMICAEVPPIEQCTTICLRDFRSWADDLKKK